MKVDNVPPAPDNLRASSDWIRDAFGLRGHKKAALRQINRCLGEIATYEFDFLIRKASLLNCLERWEQLAKLFHYLVRNFSDDPEVFCELGTFFGAHGDWRHALSAMRKGLRKQAMLRKRNILDGYLAETLEYMVVLDQKRQAISYGKKLIKKYPKYILLKDTVAWIQSDKPKTVAWAPTRASYLVRLRKHAI